MGVVIRVCFVAALLALPLAPQRFEDRSPRLPSGKTMQNAMLEADHEKNLKDAARIYELSREVEAELKKSGSTVLPTAALRNLEEIERLARNLRKRLRK
ncbi:MAG: hypothetical protein ACM3ZB_06515 [bacterium]|jgi:hypothetical protein